MKILFCLSVCPKALFRVLKILDDVKQPNIRKTRKNAIVEYLDYHIYSAKGTKGKWRYASSKARFKCATYRRYTDLSVMGVRVGVANFFLDQSIGIVETNTFQLKFFI